MKNITKLLIVGSLFISTSVYAKQTEENKLVSQANFGGVYTSMNNYSGVGYKAAVHINLPIDINAINFYGKLSYQTSHDERKDVVLYFDETELALGVAYNVNSEHRVFRRRRH